MWVRYRMSGVNNKTLIGDQQQHRHNNNPTQPDRCSAPTPTKTTPQPHAIPTNRGCKLKSELSRCIPSQVNSRRVYFGSPTGVVLHQPLNRTIFWKNDENRQNMNGIPVSPSRKTENAPTWRSPSPLFGGCFSGYFWAILDPVHLISCAFILPIPNPDIIIFI